MSDNVAVSVKDLHFAYDRTEVLHGVSFDVNEGDLLFLLGPNGSGKTTLFKCLLRLYDPSSGSIFIDGQDIHKMSIQALARKMAYIPQAHFPSFNYTVLEAVVMGRTSYIKNNSAPKADDYDAAIAALDKLGIAHLKDKGYAHISGGERQMVLIARALTQKSKVLIMDEPTASLDYGHQMTVLSVVKNLAKEGYTVILSSHNPEHAFLFANKILMIKKGNIVAMGDPAKVVNRQLLESVYEVPMDLLDVTRTENNFSRNYKVCVPVFNEGI